MGVDDLGATPDTAIDAALFRRVIGNFMSGVVVVTASHAGRRQGMTVSAISSLSLEPPMLVACLNTRSDTSALIDRSGLFAVNILSEGQGALAQQFATPAADKFHDVAVRPGRSGVPVLADALAVVECQVAEAVRGGTHLVFLGRATHAEAREGSPLAYFRGSFGRFELAQDDAVLDEVRRLVLTRALSAEEVASSERLAARLGCSESSVHYALTRLVGENLLRRVPDVGYVVVPLDAATSDDAHDAQLAIEVGAADLTVGRLTGDQVEQLRRLAADMEVLLVGGQICDVAGYIAMNAKFHAYLVGATGVSPLVRAYESLSLPDLMTRALATPIPHGAELLDDHAALVDAYEHADLARAKAVLTVHNARAKQTQRAGIERAGGAL